PPKAPRTLTDPGPGTSPSVYFSVPPPPPPREGSGFCRHPATPSAAAAAAPPVMTVRRVGRRSMSSLLRESTSSTWAHCKPDPLVVACLGCRRRRVVPQVRALLTAFRSNADISGIEGAGVIARRAPPSAGKPTDPALLGEVDGARWCRWVDPRRG